MLQADRGWLGLYRHFQKKIGEVRFAIFLQTGLDFSRSDIVRIFIIIIVIIAFKIPFASFVGRHPLQNTNYGLGPEWDCTNNGRICIKHLPPKRLP
jgi:hypothetical protein